ncbi:MAG: hypothetical protein B6U85_03600 [Desulfurococcales archaeon ex4484_42]|nr:MAG: hypothetical protein B6U85_03600 [Desulfurococcales archaeon ex4484_42]
MIFRKKEEVSKEILAAAVAAVEHYMKSKSVKEEEVAVTIPQVQELTSVSSFSSWVSIWRYEVSQQLCRRGGVKSWRSIR